MSATVPPHRAAESPNASPTVDLYEALYTTRAMRRVAPDPVPEHVVQRMLDAAVRAPSGSNSQSWRWLVVTEPARIAALGALYASAWKELVESGYATAPPLADAQTTRVVSSAQWLSENFGSVPLVVLPFHRNDPTGASIYPAVWNMMLAARGHGVGTTLTTVLGMFQHDETCRILGVPVDRGWRNAAAVTCGYPLGRWGIAPRRPVHEVVYQDVWGEAPSWRADEPLWGFAEDAEVTEDAGAEGG